MRRIRKDPVDAVEAQAADTSALIERTVTATVRAASTRTSDRWSGTAPEVMVTSVPRCRSSWSRPSTMTVPAPPPAPITAPMPAPFPPPAIAPMMAPRAAPIAPRCTVFSVWLSVGSTLPSLSTLTVSPLGVRMLSMTPENCGRSAVALGDGLEVQRHVRPAAHASRRVDARDEALDHGAAILRRTVDGQGETVAVTRGLRAQILIERRHQPGAGRDDETARPRCSWIRSRQRRGYTSHCGLLRRSSIEARNRHRLTASIVNDAAGHAQVGARVHRLEGDREVTAVAAGGGEHQLIAMKGGAGVECSCRQTACSV